MSSSSLLSQIREFFKPLADPVYAPAIACADAIDIDLDNVLYFSTVILSFIICLLLGQIGSVPLRKLFSTTTGFLIGLYFYGVLFYWNVFYILVNYLLMRCFERHLASNLMTWFSALGLISASFYHFQVKMGKDSGWDIDLIFMMNFVKFHMMAVNYDNAAKLDDKVKGKEMTERERFYAEPLRNRVHFMDFLHYFFFCGSVWTGMPIEYRPFYEYINCKGDYANIPKLGLVVPALKRFAVTIILAGCLVANLIIAPPDHLLTEEWAQSIFLYRAGYLIANVHVKVVTMFIGFTAMESNFIACGQSYQPEKKSTKKDENGKTVEVVEPESFFTIRQIRIRAIESQYSWVGAVTSWNIQVHHWLKYYVMLRLMDRNKPRGQMQVGPMLITFIVSAAWHGIEIGFFVMFIGFAFMEYFIKVGEKTAIAVWITNNVPFAVYHPIKWFYQYLTAAYLVISFQFLHFSKFNFVHSNLYYFCHWALPLSCLIVTVLPKVRRPRPPAGDEKEKKVQPEQAKKTN